MDFFTGGINNSLSNLKQCLKILYENQSSSNLRNIAEKIPYRTSRLTHLFKSFFEGSGSIRMLICVNPISEYAELLVNIKLKDKYLKSTSFML